MARGKERATECRETEKFEIQHGQRASVAFGFYRN